MGHALLWIESLAVVLLLLATLTAFTSWRTTRLGQLWMPVLTALLFIAVSSVYLWGVNFQRARGAVSDYPLYYSLSWTIALVIGSVVVLLLGLRRTA